MSQKYVLDALMGKTRNQRVIQKVSLRAAMFGAEAVAVGAWIAMLPLSMFVIFLLLLSPFSKRLKLSFLGFPLGR